MNTADFLRLAYKCASEYSDDPSTHNGAVIVPFGSRPPSGMLWGVNHFPQNVYKLPGRFERPLKYAFMEHAERDVIYKAAVRGVVTEGATLYVPWFACADCARAIICAKIKKVVGHKQIFDKTTERWRESIVNGDLMLAEAGIEREMYDGHLGGVRVLFDGEYWEP